MNRREHSHLFLATATIPEGTARAQVPSSRRLGDRYLRKTRKSVTFSRNVIRQSLVRTFLRPKGLHPQGLKKGPARALPPTFLFLQSLLVKDPTPQDAVSAAPSPVSAPGPLECRSRGSLEVGQPRRRKPASEANFVVASSVAAVVGEAYIGGHPQNCQRPSPIFLKLLRLTQRRLGQRPARPRERPAQSAPHLP